MTDRQLIFRLYHLLKDETIDWDETVEEFEKAFEDYFKNGN